MDLVARIFPSLVALCVFAAVLLVAGSEITDAVLGGRL